VLSAKPDAAVSIIPGSKYQPIDRHCLSSTSANSLGSPKLTVPGRTVPGVAVPGPAAPGLAVPGVTVPGLAVPGVVALGAMVLGFVAARLTGPGTQPLRKLPPEQLTGSEHEPSAAIPNARDNITDRFINRRFLAQWLARSLRLAAETTSFTGRRDIPRNPSRSPSPSPPVAAFPVHRSSAALPLASSR
jgi:hypothetical protein